MIRYRYSRYGTAFGIEHLFECVREALPLHRHEPGFGHTSQVLCGRARLQTTDPDYHREDVFRSRELGPADGEISFNCARPHTLVGLEPGTIVFNRLEPRPADWQRRLETEGEWHALDAKR
jgi:hypothetical protein